ncbi:alpha/beta fold hydrolase [Bacillus massilinigeriensis]|uniref:alpha/beta fold hydrolase n=1 Tax=Bacillus massilionigeriensis TaxID=1805475 RepID=UPI00096AEAC6|nr:alpha/beta hydrolase [Bacillus massilionigeriensis]
MNRKIERLSLEGVALEYSIIGKGEPILVLHGGHSNCNEEFGYKALEENGFLVITPSRPGYGGTSKAAGKNLSIACAYYAKLIDHLKIEKVHLLGISAGGPSAIYFASKYPDRVCTLTLQSAVSKTWLTQQDKEYKAARILFNPRVEKFTWQLISSINNVFPRFIFKQMFSSFSNLKYIEAREKINKDDVEAIRKMNNRQRSGYGFMIDLVQVNDITIDDLKAVTCPTLIMHSKHDGSVPLEHAYYAHENIPSSELFLLDSWGHLIWLGNSSNETDKKINIFLSSNKIS